MLKYPCLVLDHDDTVVQTERTLGYPYFCRILKEFRPEATVSLEDYVRDCHNLGFTEMCRTRWQFTEEECKLEYRGWMDYLKTHAPDSFPGIKELVHRQKEADGLICVVSHSGKEIISRDYELHFGIQPDAIYGWDYPKEQCKPNPFPLHDIMRRFELGPEELLVVDDMKLAWKMAHPLNVKIAFAAWSKADFPELATEMRRLCDFTFDTPEQLKKFLFEEDITV